MKRSPSSSTLSSPTIKGAKSIPYIDDPARQITDKVRIEVNAQLVQNLSPLRITMPSGSPAAANILPPRTPIPIPTFRQVKRTKPTLLTNIDGEVRRSERIMDSMPSPVHNVGRYARMSKQFNNRDGQFTRKHAHSHQQHDATPAVTSWKRPRTASPLRRRTPSPPPPDSTESEEEENESIPDRSSRGRIRRPTTHHDDHDDVPNHRKSSSSHASPIQQPQQQQQQRRRPVRSLKSFRIAMTSLPNSTCLELEKIATRLGAEVIKGEFETLANETFQKVSHVIVGSPPRRTLKVLAGIAMGAWIVGTSWLEACGERGGWVDETAHALDKQFPGALVSRKGTKIFANTRLFVTGETKMPIPMLRAFIHATGGILVKRYKDADVIIAGQDVFKTLKGKRYNVFTETWFMDRLGNGTAFVA